MWSTSCARKASAIPTASSRPTVSWSGRTTCWRRGWKGAPRAAGDAFSMADCAAAPALYYANLVHPLGAHARVAAYLKKLAARPAFARVLAEAEPYFKLFPG